MELKNVEMLRQKDQVYRADLGEMTLFDPRKEITIYYDLKDNWSEQVKNCCRRLMAANDRENNLLVIYILTHFILAFIIIIIITIT